MARPSPEKITDITLYRQQVYGLDADSHIRQAANRMSARTVFAILVRLDDELPDFASSSSNLLSELREEKVSTLIGFDTGDIPIGDGDPERVSPAEKPTEFYLRLDFREQDAANYQFPLFPHLETNYVLGAARKRVGAVQHLRLDLSRPKALQSFIESCRTDPHFLRMEESSAQEFQCAPSNAI